MNLFSSTIVNIGLILIRTNERFVLNFVYIVMGIQWIQVLICLVGLSIPVGVLLFAAADTARAQRNER